MFLRYFMALKNVVFSFLNAGWMIPSNSCNSCPAGQLSSLILWIIISAWTLATRSASHLLFAIVG